MTGGIDPAAAAVLGLLVAENTKPSAPAGLLTAIGMLLVALGGKHVSGGEVSAVNAVVAIVMANVLARTSPGFRGAARNLQLPSAKQKCRPLAGRQRREGWRPPEHHGRTHARER